MKEAVKAKRDAKKIWEKYGQHEDKERYQRHKKEVKKEVAQEKARASDEMYEELEISEGERKIYRIAKSRDKNTKDYSHIKQVRSSIGLTEWIPVRVGLHQGSALSPYLFDLIMDVLSQGIRGKSPGCMLLADDIVSCSTNRGVVESKLEQWRKTIPAPSPSWLVEGADTSDDPSSPKLQRSDTE
ncbi:uncharacterized protein [Macrobrachium rosenbergii]|uniref:uncharacterized protein n=1 Tax=Macrobrachium rosenbergii TaxID=79674 RepID=UPI0034D70C4D